MKKFKEEKAITLVALVITIIILLILAGVALSIVFNGGIIDKSQNAVDSYNYSSKNEEEKLSDLEAKFTQLYNERVAGEEGEEGEESSGTIGTLASNVHVGDYIEYDPTAGVDNPTTNPILSYTSYIGSLVVKDENGSDVIRAEGNSNTETHTRTYRLLSDANDETNGQVAIPTGYTIEKYGTDLSVPEEKRGQDKNESGNGYSEQSFQAKNETNDKIWRVLDVNTTTGVVKIIPEYEIKTTENERFYIKGLRGYKNAVTELNNISSIFGHGTGAASAQSITIEEVNALTGYTPAAVTSTKVGGSVNKTWNNTSYYYQGTKKPGKSGQNSNGIDNAKIYEMLIKRENTTNRSYWLASSCVIADSSFADFYLRCVGAGEVNRTALSHVYSDGRGSTSSNNRCVLPVVILQSSVNYKSGDGTSSASDKIIKFQ